MWARLNRHDLSLRHFKPTFFMNTESTPPVITDDALNKIKALFEPARWLKIEAQATKYAVRLRELCTPLLATSMARYPDHEQAALCSAANRLLLSLGSTLKPADVERFEAALKPAAAPVAAADPLVSATPAKPKRGGKADAAPPPAN